MCGDFLFLYCSTKNGALRLTKCSVEIFLGQFVLGMIEHLVGTAFLYHLAKIHEDDVVGDAEHCHPSDRCEQEW